MPQSRNNPLYKLGGRSKGKCSAHSSQTGEPCKNAAMIGQDVCRKHGGAAPQAKGAAEARVKAELEAIAFFDPGDVYDYDGHFLPVKQWPERARRALAGSETLKRNLTAGDGHMDEVLKAKLWDKVKALELLGKHYKMFTDKVEVTGELDIEARLVAGRKRVAAANE